MKRTPLARKAPLKAKARLAPRSKKRRDKAASAEGRREREHLLAVKMLPCVICNAPPPSEAHHCIHDRYSAAKVSHFQTIPLCAAHHRIGPNAIHEGKETWRRRFGADHSYLIAVLKKIALL